VPYQECDDYPTFSQYTKANFQVDITERLPDLMRQAFREATSGTPGPVNLQLAGRADWLKGDIEYESADLELVVEKSFTSVPAYRPAPEMEKVRAAAQRLQRAQRPVMVVGGGARWSGAAAECLKVAEVLSIPVATALNAYSLVPENHPLYVGVPGTYSRTCANKVLKGADLIFFVGSQTGGMLTHFYQLVSPTTEVIQMGIDPSDLGRNYPNSVSLVGDAKTALQALLGELTPGVKRDAWLAEVKALVDEWRAEVEPLRSCETVPMRPERLWQELSDWVPDDAVVVCDTGHAGMWSAQQLWMNSTRWDFLRAAGSLGWAFPASLGAKCAVPDRPVICITGDGGFWYHMQELETAVRCGIPTVTVINNNNSLSQETGVFYRAYEGKPSAQQGEMWYYSKVNFADFARTMGAVGFHVEKPSELRPALDQALACGRPAVVDVQSDIKILAPTAWVR
jgi:acetolactate synthase-1/2/3 large subunit